MITPVLLCGGAGTRLWPLSRNSYPKQFSPLIGETSLFQQTALRFAGKGFAAPVIVTNDAFRFIVIQQLQALGIDPAAVIIEPDGRNTAPAVLAAAEWVQESGAGGLVLVSPSDHAIADGSAFQEAVRTGTPAAEDGNIVTFGITPTRPETGFGYLELSAPISRDKNTALPLVGFREKPSASRAEEMLQSGNFLWNSGIFLAGARTLLGAFEAHAPEMRAQVKRALSDSHADLQFLRLAYAPWQKVTPISFDYAIMEKFERRSVVPFSGGWSDLGDWLSIKKMGSADAAQNVTKGATVTIDCSDSLLRSEADTQTLVGIGLRNIIAIAMPDAVLVADASRSQDVKLVVEALKGQGLEQAESFPKEHRPWGWVEHLVSGPRFSVKRIHVNPGGVLSLQSHYHRAEHWTVVEGTAEITIGDEIKLLSENESAFVPLGKTHRLANPGKLPVVLIETQTGSYLSEDDIVRYDDAYERF